MIFQMVKKRKRRIPRKYLYVDKDFKTRATRSKKTGRLTGRKKVRGRGDSTAVLRAKKSSPSAGHIFGRTKPIRVRSSKKRKGTIRRRL